MKKAMLVLLLAAVFFLIGYTKQLKQLERKVVIEAMDEITIKTGKSSILLKKDGTISINGKNISIKASGDITMKGKKINEN
jgi:type VI secretion system secreted protein VgrG